MLSLCSIQSVLGYKFIVFDVAQGEYMYNECCVDY